MICDRILAGFIENYELFILLFCFAAVLSCNIYQQLANDKQPCDDSQLNRDRMAKGHGFVRHRISA